MYSALSIFILVLVGLIGFERIRNRNLAIQSQIKFSSEFLGRFKKFVESFGRAQDEYVWLTKNAATIQNRLGSFGTFAHYSEPFRANYKNFAIIVNFLPQLNHAFLEGEFDEDERFKAVSVQDCLLRHIGFLETIFEEERDELRNPFICLREGMQRVLGLPISMLQFSGLISETTFNRLINNLIVKILAAVLAILSVLANVFQVVLGWPDFIKMIGKRYNK